MKIRNIANNRQELTKGYWVYIGGLDPAKFSDAQGFSNYFRISSDPSNPEVIGIENITDYRTEPDGNGFLNVAVRINKKFQVPSYVFSNYSNSFGTSQLTYFIDPNALNTSIGIRSFAANPIKHVLTRNLISVSTQWNGFGSATRIVDFEQLGKFTSDFMFHDYRDNFVRLNVRNVVGVKDKDYSGDTSIYNFWNGVIYANPILQTINAGFPLNSLQLAASKPNVEIRYVTNKSLPNNFADGDIDVTNTSDTSISLNITEPTSTNTIDYYNIFIKDLSDPNNIVNLYFPYQELESNVGDITGLNPNTTYEICVQAVDIFFNKNEKSKKIVATTNDNFGKFLFANIANPTAGSDAILTVADLFAKLNYHKNAGLWDIDQASNYIVAFKIRGNDVQAYLHKEYFETFYANFQYWNNGSSIDDLCRITKFYDYDAVVKTFSNSNTFYQAGLEQFSAPNLEVIQGGDFDCNFGFAPKHKLTLFYAPKLIELGTTSNENTFRNGISSSCVLTVSSTLQTNNNGNPDGDIAYAASTGATVNYI